MEHKKIKILGSGPNGNYEPGSIVVVDKVRATVLINNGYAEEVKKEPAESDSEKVKEDGTGANKPAKPRTNKPTGSKKTSKTR